MTDKNSLWNSAARAGIVLGGVSILYLLLTALTALAASGSKTVGILMTLINALLWIAKFGGCIYLMRLFMLRFSLNNPDAGNARVFRFGAAAALLSALVYSAFYLAYMLFVAPDTISEAFAIMRDNPMMDSNMLEMMDQLEPKMPTYTFFANLIYCTLFGTVLSAVFSANIPPKNPFNEGDNSNIDDQ